MPLPQTVWTTYTVPELKAFGAPVDMVACAEGGILATIKNPSAALTDEERAVWDRLTALWLPYFEVYHRPPALARRPGDPLLRVDLFDLVECLLTKPHQRQVFPATEL